MPEGHTIHRVARDHGKFFGGERLLFSSPQGRFTEDARRINRRPIQDVTAHGKHLFYHFSKRIILHVHLGLYGKFKTHHLPLPEPKGAIRLRGIGESRGFDLRGPTRCELLDAGSLQLLIARLGPDPLRSDADPELVWKRISKSQTPIGAQLLNKSIISGIGNVYRADILFEAKISPFRQGNSVSREEFDTIWTLAKNWLRLGVKYNRIITFDAKQIGKTPGKLLARERLLIYKKTTCPDCGSDVANDTVGARTIYYCGRCQH